MRMLITIFLTVITSVAIAGSQAGLPLKGKINLLLGIDITPTTAASTLNLTQSQTDLKVATGHVISNSGTGFKVTVSSANQGRLKRLGGSEYFGYSMKFGPIPLNLTSTSPIDYTYGGTLNYTDNISVSYTGVPAASLVAGEYSDTITFTISAL